MYYVIKSSQQLLEISIIILILQREGRKLAQSHTVVLSGEAGIIAQVA